MLQINVLSVLVDYLIHITVETVSDKARGLFGADFKLEKVPNCYALTYMCCTSYASEGKAMNLNFFPTGFTRFWS